MKKRYSFAVGARVSVHVHGALCNATIIARALTAHAQDVYLVRVHHHNADDVVMYYASAITIRAAQYAPRELTEVRIRMRQLPSEQRKNIVAALKTLRTDGHLRLSQPCDCGSQVRHNNGGNYHAVAEFVRDSGAWYARKGTTYEYDESEWIESSIEEIEDYVREHADWIE